MVVRLSASKGPALLISAFLLSAAWWPLFAQTADSFPTVLFQGRSFQEAWGVLDQILGPPGQPPADRVAAEGALSALQTAAMNVTEAQREALILRTVDALFGRAGRHGAKSEWPGPVMPAPLARLYDTISRFQDLTLRTTIIRAASQTAGLQLKPLILEAERLVHRFESLDRLREKQPVPWNSITEDLLLEEEASAIVEACRGRMNDALALILSDIARLSGESRTVSEARLLARGYWSAKNGAGNSKP